MYAESAYSLLVPLCVVVLVLITRRVVLSLFVGLCLAGMLIGFGDSILYGGEILWGDHLGRALFYVYHSLSGVLYTVDDDGLQLEWSSLYVFGFLFVLGILTQLVSYSGGVSAFVAWARKRVNSARGSEFLAFIAGLVIFIDDYFNALTVGQISKSLNDANHSTRERLAYIIDSTAAPVCILVPLSSWGAYILGLLSGMGEENGLFMLLASIWGNYYAWLALFGVLLVIYWQVNLPAMKRNQNIGVTELKQAKQRPPSHLALLLLPILALIVLVAVLILYTGYVEAKQGGGTYESIGLIEMLANTQTGFSLFWGGVGALFLGFVISYKHLDTGDLWPLCKLGILSMLPASLILVLAWGIGPVIKEDLKSGIYLASLTKAWLENSSLSPSVVVPLCVFVISGFMAFCTGTSWGSFAIMLPIASSLALAQGLDFSLIMSAVLSGAVYGDHASPISDTTILSATGAGCSVQSHFITQLPYVSTIAAVSFISFLIASTFNSLIAGHVVGILLCFGIFWLYKTKHA